MMITTCTVLKLLDIPFVIEKCLSCCAIIKNERIKILMTDTVTFFVHFPISFFNSYKTLSLSVNSFIFFFYMPPFLLLLFPSISLPIFPSLLYAINNRIEKWNAWKKLQIEKLISVSTSIFFQCFRFFRADRVERCAE